MGCNDNSQDGGCRLSKEQLDKLASDITSALSNIPINTTVTIGGNVSLGGGIGSPVIVGNKTTDGQDLFPGKPPALDQNKLKDFLCDIAARAEKDIRFKQRAKQLGTKQYTIVIKILIKERIMPISIPVTYPMPNGKNTHQQLPKPE